MTLAAALTQEAHRPTASALADGWSLADQARAIVHAVDALPASMTAGDRRKAEEHLVHLAAAHDAADADLARRLRPRKPPRPAPGLTLLDDGNGSAHGRFRVPPLNGPRDRCPTPTDSVPEDKS